MRSGVGCERAAFRVARAAAHTSAARRSRRDGAGLEGLWLRLAWRRAGSACGAGLALATARPRPRKTGGSTAPCVRARQSPTRPSSSHARGGLKGVSAGGPPGASPSTQAYPPSEARGLHQFGTSSAATSLLDESSTAESSSLLSSGASRSRAPRSRGSLSRRSLSRETPSRETLMSMSPAKWERAAFFEHHASASQLLAWNRTASASIQRRRTRPGMRKTT